MMGDIDMILNIIATAIDVIMILSLMVQQVKQTDNSNAIGHLLFIRDLCNEYYSHLEMMGYRQTVRHRILIPVLPGSNPCVAI